MDETRTETGKATPRGYTAASGVVKLPEVEKTHESRTSTDIGELDRVLGGGLVSGSVVLIGGDPGIGKSTLLLQAASKLAGTVEVLYVTGEESLEQVALRAHRLGLDGDVNLMSETSIEAVLETGRRTKPNVMVIDSVQTLFSQDLQSAPGSVAQLREVAGQVVRFAKATGTAVFLVGHVTKEGVIAGPRVLEHMVDTVLYFENDTGSRFRIVRAVKNRFGAANELGIFAMTDDGLKPVRNPSSLFLSKHRPDVPGSIVTVTREGTRPLLVEVQALVDVSHVSHPRRVTTGLEQNRLALLLAVAHKHAQVPLYDQDVFLNVVGGVRISETSADLPAVIAVVSSFLGKNLPHDIVVFGEVGLAGEVRPVPFGEERLREARKHGFARAIVPAANVPKRPIDEMQIIGVDRIDTALADIFDING